MENTDLISRAKAMNAIKNELTYQEKHATPGEDIDTGIICGLRQAVEIVKGIEPSAEKTGEWFDKGSLSCRCSECGCKSPKEYTYCPNCGARMVE